MAINPSLLGLQRVDQQDPLGIGAEAEGVQENQTILHDPEGMWEDLHSLNPQWNAYRRVLAAKGAHIGGFSPFGSANAIGPAGMTSGAVQQQAGSLMDNQLDPAAATYGMLPSSRKAIGSALKGLQKQRNQS